MTAEKVTLVPSGAREIDAIRTVFAQVAEDDLVIFDRLLIGVLRSDSRLFSRPVAPIRELIDGAGLILHSDFVGTPDADWDSVDLWLSEDEDLDEDFDEDFEDDFFDDFDDDAWEESFLADDYDLGDYLDTAQLDGCCREAMEVVVDAWRKHLLEQPFSAREASKSLAHGGVAEDFSRWLAMSFGLDHPDIVPFGQALLGGRRTAGPVQYILARHTEAVGDGLGAEALLEEAVVASPEHGPSLVELASFASDRGDANRALSLLRRAGAAEDDPEVRMLKSLLDAVPVVGRNDPCPCGSGRKFKQCHLGRTEPATRERLNWLTVRLTNFVTRDENKGLIINLAATALDARVAPTEEFLEMVTDPFIRDLAIFESGGIDLYLDVRGPLLADDERETLESWARHGRLRLWEITDTDGVGAVTMRDTRTGDTVELTDRGVSERARPGDQILARVLTAWGEHWITGLVLVILPQHRRSLMLELDSDADDYDLAAWYSAWRAPPTVLNRDGDPLMNCEAKLRPTKSWDELEGFLDGAFELEEEGVWSDIEYLDEDEGTIRAWLRRDGDELTVETNSEARLDETLETLTLAGYAEVVSRTAEPFEFTRSGGQPQPPEPPSEELASAMEQIRDRMEQRWLDESIPALDGLTPRQAAADPTRREDLIALLRSFDSMEKPVLGSGGFAMRASVLRRELGIDDG